MTTLLNLEGPDLLLEELRRHYRLECSETAVGNNIPTSTTSRISRPISMAIPEPRFTFCGTFSGKDNISAARWIKKLEFELGPLKS